MKRTALLKRLPLIIGITLILLIAVLVFVFREFFEKPVQTKKQVQQISVVKPPDQPPPPPPPKPEIKPPEVKEEKIPEPEPEAKPDEPEPEPEPEAEAPPAGEDLGVDAEGGAGGDSFGLVGKKGGAGLIGSGSGKGTGDGKSTIGGGGGGGNAILWYAQHVQRELASELDTALKDRARQTSYTAVLQVWISPNGDIERVELVNSSGTAVIDDALKAALSQIRGRFKPPPERMPQPLKIRIRS
jgi:protein TonB